MPSTSRTTIALFFVACLSMLAGCAGPGDRVQPTSQPTQPGLTAEAETTPPPAAGTSTVLPTTASGGLSDEAQPRFQDTPVSETVAFGQLPEILVSAETELVVSPSHPASYVTARPVSAGSKVRMLGKDEDGAWLLVLHDNTIGWLPSVFSGSNIGTLDAKLVVEPLSSKCAKYAGTVVSPLEEWVSVISGPALIQVIIYRPVPQDVPERPRPGIEISGLGQVEASGYRETSLGEAGQVDIFDIAIEDLPEGSHMKLQLDGLEGESLALQASLFSEVCQDESALLQEREAEETSGPRNEGAEPDDTGEPLVIPVVSSIWSVNAYSIDDAAAVFVDGEMVVGGLYQRETDWVDITDHVNPEQPTEVLFVSLNGQAGGSWGFAIQRNDTVVWGEEGQGSASYVMQYVKAVLIWPDGRIESLQPRAPLVETVPGAWRVQIQDAADLAVVSVNGWPVAAAFGGSDTDWIDLTQYLDRFGDNVLSMHAWNVEGSYSYGFAIQRNDEVAWEFQRAGSGILGKVFENQMIVTGDGQLVEG